MRERKDHLWKPGAASQEEIEKLVETSSNPIGLDVGTSKIAVARQTGNDVKASSELNAFFQVPHSRFTEKILEQNQITNYREGDELVIYGTATDRFANMFNAEARLPARRLGATASPLPGVCHHSVKGSVELEDDDSPSSASRSGLAAANSTSV